MQRILLILAFAFSVAPPIESQQDLLTDMQTCVVSNAELHEFLVAGPPLYAPAAQEEMERRFAFALHTQVDLRAMRAESCERPKPARFRKLKAVGKRVQPLISAGLSSAEFWYWLQHAQEPFPTPKKPK